MTSGLIQIAGKKAKKSAKAVAQQVAKAAKEEQEGLLESVKSHVVKKPVPQPDLVSEIVTGKQVSPGEEAKIKSETKSNIQRLEVKLAQLRRERTQREEQWRQDQEALMKTQQEEDVGAIAAPSSSQKGPKGPVGKRKTKGTKELIRSKK